MSKRSKCRHCGSDKHTSIMCFLAPRKPIKHSGRFIRQESPKTRQKRLQTAQEWHEANPPDEYGLWDCYLNISPDCYIKVDITTLNREHKKSKTRRPDLKHDITNIGAACPPCNELKGSRNAEELIGERFEDASM